MGRHGAAHFYPNIELLMGLPQLGEATQVLPRSLATDAGYQAPNGAAHGLRQSSRHAPHAQYGGHVSQILGLFAACSYFMGMRRLALPRPRARVPSWDEVINIHVMEHHYARLDNIPCQAGG